MRFGRVAPALIGVYRVMSYVVAQRMRLIEGQLLGVTAADVVTFLGVPLVLVAVAALALGAGAVRGPGGPGNRTLGRVARRRRPV